MDQNLEPRGHGPEDDSKLVSAAGTRPLDLAREVFEAILARLPEGNRP